MPGDDFALRLEGVTKQYVHQGQDLLAVDGISLDVEEGEFVAILGRSGSGKSTLLALCGLMDAPTEGRVLHRGSELSRVPERERARARLTGIGFVFQHFYLVPTLTAEENVALPLRAASVPADERQERLDELFRAIELDARRSHYPHEMSGGEQQRVAVARALANRPWLLLADEPTGDLDPESSARVMALLRQANEERDATVIMVTHDDDAVPQGARRVVLERGRLAL